MSHCTKMEMDKNLMLVKIIEKFPCLYKSDTIGYATRYCTDQAWREVSKELHISVVECKEKWKNLRYGLLRSLRPTRDGSAKKKYYLHDEMSYLIPYIGAVSTKSKKMCIDELEFKNENYINTFKNERLVMSNDLESYDNIEYEAPQTIYSEPEKTKVNSSDDDDPRKMFLLSLLPEITDFSETQMKNFRRRIFGLIDEINTMEQNFTVIKSEPL